MTARGHQQTDGQTCVARLKTKQEVCIAGHMMPGRPFASHEIANPLEAALILPPEQTGDLESQTSQSCSTGIGLEAHGTDRTA